MRATSPYSLARAHRTRSRSAFTVFSANVNAEQRSGRIAVVGSIMTDLITYVTRMPERGETLDAPRFAMAPGGKGANQAVAAALLGSPVVFVACVGDDAFGEAARANLTSLGIATEHVRTVAGTASGVAPIVVEPSGENRILIVRGANDALAPDDLVRAEADLRTCAALVVQLETPLETVYAAIERGVALGLQVVLNPAPAVADLDIARLRGIAYLIPNQSELALLSGLPVATRDEVVVAARALIARGIERIVVTLGADGALLVEANETLHVPGVAVDAVDTTGAGDAFIGSFIHHLTSGHSTRIALERAVRYAADSVTKPGTQRSYATRAAFEALLAAAH
jgi:ribokinase